MHFPLRQHPGHAPGNAAEGDGAASSLSRVGQGAESRGGKRGDGGEPSGGAAPCGGVERRNGGEPGDAGTGSSSPASMKRPQDPVVVAAAAATAMAAAAAAATAAVDGAARRSRSLERQFFVSLWPCPNRIGARPGGRRITPRAANQGNARTTCGKLPGRYERLGGGGGGS